MQLYDYNGVYEDVIFSSVFIFANANFKSYFRHNGMVNIIFHHLLVKFMLILIMFYL